MNKKKKKKFAQRCAIFAWMLIILGFVTVAITAVQPSLSLFIAAAIMIAAAIALFIIADVILYKTGTPCHTYWGC